MDHWRLFYAPLGLVLALGLVPAPAAPSRVVSTDYSGLVVWDEAEPAPTDGCWLARLRAATVEAWNRGALDTVENALWGAPA